MQNTLTAIPAFKDNYIWLLQAKNNCAVVDPGDAAPVLAYLKQHHLQLTTILITHHHNDHIGGMLALKKATGATLYGPKHDGIDGLDHLLEDHDTITVFDRTFKIISVPGHTLGHIVYYGDDTLFCGDTLFGGGCGRLFEGTPAQLFDSLNKLKALPDQTKVYCAHEYTLQNLQFAKTVDPNNQAIDNRIQAAIKTRANGQSTVPSTLALEKATNPFLRCKTVEAFARIRKLKDTF